MSKETKAQLQGKLTLTERERDSLRKAVEALQEARAADDGEKRQLVRALSAGTRRYNREQMRNRHLNERVILQANHRVELVEHAAMETALTALEAVQDAHESRKDAAAAKRRADKLGAKLVRRGLEAGKERRAWVGQAKGREKALQNAIKRADGLQESLRESKLRNRATRAENERLQGLLTQAQGREDNLRRKLREANKSVLMASLGHGLEVRPVSGLQHEDTTGYSPAARRAAGGQR